MKTKVVYHDPQTFVLVLDTSDDVTKSLLGFAKSHEIAGASFTAIGAFERCTLGYFDWETKKYERIPVNEQVEVLSLVGNFARQDAQPKLHAHVVVGRRDGTAHGGHLLEAFVRPTLEVVVVETPAHLRRSFDETTGLALIRL